MLNSDSSIEVYFLLAIHSVNQNVIVNCTEFNHVVLCCSSPMRGLEQHLIYAVTHISQKTYSIKILLT